MCFARVDIAPFLEAGPAKNFGWIGASQRTDPRTKNKCKVRNTYIILKHKIRLKWESDGSLSTLDPAHMYTEGVSLISAEGLKRPAHA